MKSKICSDAMTIRHGMSENENLKREIDHLQENINHLKIENQDMKKESEILKEKAYSLEKQNIYLRNEVENKQEKLDSVNRELERTNSLLNTQRQISRGTSKQREFIEEYKESSSVLDHIPTSDQQYDQNKIIGISSPQLKFEISQDPSYPDLENRNLHSNTYRESSNKRSFHIPSSDHSPGNLDFLERKLQELFDKKKMFESDYSKLPIVANKSVQWEKKKNYLEAELDTVEKDISAVRRKIRDIKKSQTEF